jgi:hypothetical protein
MNIFEGFPQLCIIRLFFVSYPLTFVTIKTYNMLTWHTIAAGFVPMIALAASFTIDALESDSFSCGTIPSEEFMERSKDLAREEAIARKLGRRVVQELQINVYMHVIAASEDPNDGNLSVGSDITSLPFHLRYSRVSHIISFNLCFTTLYEGRADSSTRIKTSLTNSKSSKLTLTRRVSFSTSRVSTGHSTLRGPTATTLAACGTLFVMAAIPTLTYGLSLR